MAAGPTTALPHGPIRRAEAQIDQALAGGKSAEAVVKLANSLSEDELRAVAMCALLRLVVVRQRERRSR